MNENKGKLDNVLEESYLKGEAEDKAEYTLKAGHLGEKVVSAYKAIEESVVESYQKIEDAVVDSYKKIEDKFVETFLEKK